MSEILELYLLGVGGVVLHFLTKIYNARKTGKVLDYVLEGISVGISTLIVILFVYAKDDLDAFYPLTMFTSILLGYSAQSVARQLFKMAMPKSEEQINF
mgnify:CR=1 FL=1|jgi:hypothetical protein|tara:strand:- start:1744 stop:2040 length:297 start_codon:yes stop_codon:yes gene_type:complete